jgi:hypothetical protein
MQSRHPPASSIPSPKVTDDAESAGALRISVVDGPYDGLVYAGLTNAVTFGRGIDNTIVLSLDPQISRNHCMVRYSSDDQAWLLEDCGSANGTWYDSQQIEAPTVLSTDSEFVLGTTVVRILSATENGTFLPDPERVEDGVRKIAGRLDLFASRGFGAAQMLALNEKCVFLSARHLFLGLISTNPELACVAHGKGLFQAQFIRDRVEANDYWSGDKSWIGQLVGIASSETNLFSDQLITTPRVYRVFIAAEDRVEKSRSEQISSTDLLYALFSDEDGRLREWFHDDGGNLKNLMAALTRQPTQISELRLDSSAEAGIQRETSVQAEATTSALKALDPAVTDLAEATLRVATKYHLADVSERRLAIKKIMTSVIASVSPERRTQILEQLRPYFPLSQSFRTPPVVTDAIALEEVNFLRDRVRELEEALEKANGVKPSHTAQIPWSEVLSTESELRTDRLRPRDAASVELVRYMVEFSTAIERFVIGVVAGLTQRGSMSGLVSIPGFSTTIRRSINLCVSGQPLTDDFKPYLTAIETWIVATIAAYHSAPEDWFSGYWKKTSPSRIEALVPAKFLSDAKCWAHYKNIVRRISPDLVGDEIQAMVRVVAQRKFDELVEGRR